MFKEYIFTKSTYSIDICNYGGIPQHIKNPAIVAFPITDSVLNAEYCLTCILIILDFAVLIL